MASPLPEHPWLTAPEPGMVELRFPSHASDEALIACLEAIHQFYRALQGTTTFLVDLSHITSASAQQRKIIADYEAKTGPIAQGKLLGQAFYVDNALQRGMLTAVYWIHPPAYTYRIFSRRDAAIEWLRQLRS